MNWISGIPALLGVLTLAAASGAQPSPAPDYSAQAHEVTRFIQEKLYLPQHGLYAQSLASATSVMWGNGSSLLPRSSGYLAMMRRPISQS